MAALRRRRLALQTCQLSAGDVEYAHAGLLAGDTLAAAERELAADRLEQSAARHDAEALALNEQVDLHQASYMHRLMYLHAIAAHHGLALCDRELARRYRQQPDRIYAVIP